jgi:hypothetical protein
VYPYNTYTLRYSAASSSFGTKIPILTPWFPRFSTGTTVFLTEDLEPLEYIRPQTGGHTIRIVGKIQTSDTLTLQRAKQSAGIDDVQNAALTVPPERIIVLRVALAAP